MRKIVPAAVAAVLMTAAGVANAATATTTFGVSATVLKACQVTATALAFGNYTPGAGAIAGNSAVNVTCTKGTSFTVALNGGTTTGGTIAQRLMTAGAADTLRYNLYTTSGLATIFGDGTTGVTMPGTGAGLATAQTVQVFGQVPDSALNQAVTPGSYTDTIGVTVTY